MKRHRSTLQTLLHLYKIDPEKLEKIMPTHRPPNFHPTHSTVVEQDKKMALELDKKIGNEGVRIYVDGSGFGGNIGVAAVLYENGTKKRTLKFHLGPELEHTVYEGGHRTGKLLQTSAKEKRPSQYQPRQLSCHHEPQ